MTLSFVDFVADAVLRTNIALEGLASLQARDKGEAEQLLIFLSRLMLNKKAVENIKYVARDRTEDLADASRSARLELEGKEIVYLVDFSELHNMIHRNEISAHPTGHIVHALVTDPIRPHRLLISPSTANEIEHYLLAMSERLEEEDEDAQPATSGNGKRSANSGKSRLLSLEGYERLGAAFMQFKQYMASCFDKFTDEEARILEDDWDNDEFLRTRDAVFNHLRSVRSKTRYSDAIDAWNVAAVSQLNRRTSDTLYRLVTRSTLKKVFERESLAGSPCTTRSLGIDPLYGCSATAAFYHAEAHRNSDSRDVDPQRLARLGETVDYLYRTTDALLDMWESNKVGHPIGADELDQLGAFEIDRDTRMLAGRFAKSVGRGRAPLVCPEQPLKSTKDREKIVVKIRGWAQELGDELWERMSPGRLIRRDRRGWNASKWLRGLGDPTQLLRRSEEIWPPQQES